MADLPLGMLRNGRPRDPIFEKDEYLYRRVNPEHWHERLVDRAAIALPDMSVGRGKYGHPEWLRLEADDLQNWAVVGFQVKDLEGEILHQGIEKWTFEARHVPLDDNYPHSEIWAFKDGSHVNAKVQFDPVMHLRWKDKLRWKIRTILRPYQTVEIRQDPPKK